MHAKSIFLAGLTFFLALSTANAQQRFSKEIIFNKEKGFLTCSGQTSAPLFKQDCLELSFDRISFGGQIMYEGSCLDANGKKFRLSCSNFVFEPDVIDANAKKSYFDK